LHELHENLKAAKPIRIVPERVGRCQQARAPWTIVRGTDFCGSQ
jgi:hypothetical protein